MLNLDRRSFVLLAIFLLVSTSIASSFVIAQRYDGSTRSQGSSGRYNSRSFTNYQNRPSFETYYSGSDIDNYWPGLNSGGSCEPGQDLLLSVAPAGCQPTVVRSDLLAEQDVPVFCKLDAFKINPLIDVNQIRNIRFTGETPMEVSGFGFHPARAALRTHDRLLGSPLVNNVGYVVVLLKRQPQEDLLPEFVNVSLNAEIEYVSGNAFGIGRAEFLLDETSSDERWDREKDKQSFWNGRYSVRLEEVDRDYALVSIYEGDKKVMTKRVERGRTSEASFLPGLYCRAGLEIAYDDFESADRRARIEVSSGSGYDTFDVVEGSRFLDDRCTIRRIDVDENGETGKVEGQCRGDDFILTLKPRGRELFETFVINGTVQEPERESDGSFTLDLRELKNEKRRGRYILNPEGELNRIPNVGESRLVVSSDGGLIPGETAGGDDWFTNLWKGMKEFRERVEKDSGFKLGRFVNNDLSDSSRVYFENAIGTYERIADDYPSAQQADFEGAKSYGEIALEEAISLSKEFGMDSTQAGMINKLAEVYPGADNASYYTRQLNDLFRIDSTLSGEAVQFDDQVRTIRVISVEEPEEKPRVELFVEGNKVIVKKGERTNFTDAGIKRGELVVDDLDPDSALIGAYCIDTDSESGRLEGKRTFSLEVDGETHEICGLTTGLDKVSTRELAKIRLLPQADRTRTQTNFSVNIGIEKRAIELNPDKAQKKIDNLNESIEKWEEVSNKLGNVVDGMKGACLATGAALTLKNFLTGLGGDALARQKVMGGDEGWRNWCREQEALGAYVSVDACYNANDAKIDDDVRKTADALNKVNEDISKFQKEHETSTDIFGKSVDSDLLREDLAKFARENYGDETINVSGLRDKWVIDGKERDIISVREILSAENIEEGIVTTDGIREIMLQAELRERGISGISLENNRAGMVDVAGRLNDNRIISENIRNEDKFTKLGLPPPMYVMNAGEQSLRPAKVIQVGEDARRRFGFSESVSHVATIRTFGRDVSVEGEGTGSFDQGLYVVGLEGGQDGVYSIREVSRQNSAVGGANVTYSAIDKSSVPTFGTTFGIGNVKDLGGLDYSTEIVPEDRIVRYYETEPYKGMPAIVPFDRRGGWYAATRQTLPVFGGIGAFDASGRVTSFWMCNVGQNGRIQFESGFGDDLCQQVNLNTGQPLGEFPGLNSGTARTLTNKAIRAIEDAARQHGSKLVNINGENFKTAISVGQIGTECQDFMSPSDCHLMFNVCDPVVCPTSRCDLGGTYPVANVAQTGIVGSVFLCLPNIKEGIVIPVCLSGINAGIDGFLSVMKSYQSCLQDNVDTGELGGICDQVYSIYMCDFFWGQVAPLVNVLAPKLIETAYGQGVRGGAEYLTIASAWQNMENSLNYFTESYAVNSVNAFKTAGIQEVGTEFCKGWVSAKAPTQFKTFIEPDSPPQFHAWFDARRFSDTTVPATSQYKVFYHIFAGKNSGSYYNVFLKNPPDSPYYLTAAQVPVASGFIPAGEFATETKDFTAPEGYKELCVRVNDQEECGFGKVTTSFAVNYLSDQYVKDEAANRNIQSERDCISGDAHPAALLNPNLQAAAEELASPAIYERGVVRICSSQNPGLGSDPSRFVNVGQCDDPKIGCWMDKSSVEDAISNSNLGTLNESLEVLEQRTIEMMQGQGTLFRNSTAVGEIRSLQTALEGLKNSRSQISDVENINDRVDFIFDKLVWNHHKAELLLVKARANAIVARSLKTENDAGKEAETEAQSQGAPATGGTSSDGGGDGVVCGEGAHPADLSGDGVIDGCEEDGSEGTPLGESGGSSELADLCVLESANWVDENFEILNLEDVVFDSDIVYASVQGSEECEGQEIEFSIFEDDFFGESPIESISARMENGFAESEWNAQWLDDGLFQGEPEFYFTYNIVGDGVGVDKSDLLTVERVEETVVGTRETEGSFYSLNEISSSRWDVLLNGDLTGITLEKPLGGDYSLLLNGLNVGKMEGGIIDITSNEALRSNNGIFVAQLDGRSLGDLENGLIEFDENFVVEKSYEIDYFEFEVGGSVVTNDVVSTSDQVHAVGRLDCDSARLVVSYNGVNRIDKNIEDYIVREAIPRDSGDVRAFLECKNAEGVTLRKTDIKRMEIATTDLPNPLDN